MMERTPVDNDTRGWILCFVSGAACVLGSSVICVDFLIRLLPGHSSFSINRSSVFLASSLSLSFGVMLFSALYSMLPNAKEYFIEAGYGSQAAGSLMVAWFACGFLGIQLVSRFLHRFMPSHVVDCDHHHDGPKELEAHSHDDSHDHEHYHDHDHDHTHDHDHDHDHNSHTHSPTLINNHDPHRPQLHSRRRHLSEIPPSTISEDPVVHTHLPTTESTPLLASNQLTNGNGHPQHNGSTNTTTTNGLLRPPHPAGQVRSQTTPAYENGGKRPPMAHVQERVISFVKDLKGCDELGPCYGYSDPCGQECYKHLQPRVPSSAGRINLRRGPTGSHGAGLTRGAGLAKAREPDVSEVAPASPAPHRASRPSSRSSAVDVEECCPATPLSSPPEDVEAQHHHHVPTNAFLSLGLQTSIAIALHKFPEGFITFATNHANPTLGFNVFMALFVHNITEGFTIALPLYMALGSRAKAMLWASILGGLSQPLGAAVAALWFRLARKTHMAPNTAVYAGLFAVTAGIMVSVALQLFVESLSLNHNRNLSTFFAFLGMIVLGLSNSLVESD